MRWLQTQKARQAELLHAEDWVQALPDMPEGVGMEMCIANISSPTGVDDKADFPVAVDFPIALLDNADFHIAQVDQFTSTRTKFQFCKSRMVVL